MLGPLGYLAGVSLIDVGSLPGAVCVHVILQSSGRMGGRGEGCFLWGPSRLNALRSRRSVLVSVFTLHGVGKVEITLSGGRGHT